jgi:hypothetical protein
VEPPGPAFGRPDDELRDTHHMWLMKMMGFARAQPILRAILRAVLIQ